MTRRLALALAAALAGLAPTAPAVATTIPLLDLPPGVKTASVGVNDLTLHGSFDMALWGWAQGWTAGLAGGVDYANPYRRESNHMLALRAGRRMGGEWPFSWGFLLSAGANIVDPTAPLPRKTSQRFDSDFLLWVQPAVVVASTYQDEKLWIRGTFGPVIGRWSEGEYLLPWLVPSLEVAYRYTAATELVVGGGYASPYTLGVRGAF